MASDSDVWAGDLRNYDGADWPLIIVAVSRERRALSDIVALVTTFDELSLDDIHAYSDSYPMPLLARAT